jgi:hypothetical protein
MKVFALFAAVFICMSATAQRDLTKKFPVDHWSAKWICSLSHQAKDYGVYHFRKNTDISNIPESLPSG